jgi:hypothetical protein
VVHAGAEVEFQALTGYVSRVPRDATATGHLRDGNFVIILRGTKEPEDAKVTSKYGESLPSSFLACPATKDEVLIGNHNASRYIQKLADFAPEVKSYINFRDTGKRVLEHTTF